LTLNLTTKYNVICRLIYDQLVISRYRGYLFGAILYPGTVGRSQNRSGTTDLFDLFSDEMISVSRNKRLELAAFAIFTRRLSRALAVRRWIILARSGTLFSGKVRAMAAHLAPVDAAVLLRGFRVHLQHHHHRRHRHRHYHHLNIF